MLAVTQLAGFGPGGIRPVDITWRDESSDTTDTATYSFATQDFGNPEGDRHIIVGVSGRANLARTLTSVTIGGVAATHLATANDAGGGTDIAALYIAAVPAGSTGTVAVVFSDVMLRCAIMVWKMPGARNATAFATQTDTTLTGSVYSVSIDVPANGAAVGMYWCGLSAGSASVTWAGLTEDFDGTVETTANGYAGARANFTAAQSGLTVSGTQAGTPATGGLAVASFGP